MQIKCFACPNSYHPATGHWFGEQFPDIFYCGPCATLFFKWMKGYMKRKWSGSAFYEEAATSVWGPIGKLTSAGPQSPLSLLVHEIFHE